MTIAGMVLVNNPGTWSAIYGPLKHAEWHGITPTDYIFPFFLFIVGIAIPMSLDKRIAEGVTRKVYTKIFIRSAAIFASGLAISALPLFIINETTIPSPLKWLAAISIIAALYFLYVRSFRIAGVLIGVWAIILIGSYFAGYQITPYNINTMRIPGVLQRIAVCYLVVSLIYLHTTWKQQAVIGTFLLLFYWVLMTKVPVPACEITSIDDKECNFAAFLDRLILGVDHIWKAGKVFDPEGILSTLPAISTTISGSLAGSWLKRRRNIEVRPNEEHSTPRDAYFKMETVAGLFFGGTILLAIGWSWSLIFPLNKSLWTSSYAVYTSGLALLTLGVCYYLIDIKGHKRWAKPFVIFGVNALALFVFSGIMARMLGIIRVAVPDGKEISLQQWIFQNIFLTLAEPVNASLAYAITFVLFWLFLMWLLFRRGILIKL